MWPSKPGMEVVLVVVLVLDDVVEGAVEVDGDVFTGSALHEASSIAAASNTAGIRRSMIINCETCKGRLWFPWTLLNFDATKGSLKLMAGGFRTFAIERPTLKQRSMQLRQGSRP